MAFEKSANTYSYGTIEHLSGGSLLTSAYVVDAVCGPKPSRRSNSATPPDEWGALVVELQASGVDLAIAAKRASMATTISTAADS